MSALRSIIKNTAARTGTEITNRVSSAIFWVLLARFLGVSALGMLAFGMSLFSLFQSLSSLGLGAFVTREVSQRRDNAKLYFGTALLIGVSTTLIFVAIMLLSGRLISPDAATMRIVTILALALLPTSVFNWSRSILSAVERMEYIAYARVFENGFKIIVGSILLVLRQGLETITLVIVISKVISATACYTFAVNEVGRPHFEPNRKLFKKWLKHVPTFLSISVFNGFFWSSTIIILTHFSGSEAAGIFSAAYKLVDICVALILAYGQALFPITSKFSMRSPEVFAQLCRKSIKLVVMFTLAAATVTTILAEKIIMFIYGSGLIAASSALRVQIWLLVPFGAVPIFAFALISSHYQKQDLKANIIAAISLIGLNFMLTPRYGVIGASAALVAGCAIFFASEYVFVSAQLFEIKIQPYHFKLPLVILMMTIVVTMFYEFHVILVIVISTGFYVSLLYVSRLFSTNDKAFYNKLRSI